MVSGLVAVSVLVALMSARGAAKVVFWNLPATLVHELAHWSVALVTGCRPGIPSLWPKRLPSGAWQLGSVSFTARPGPGAWVALAPLFLGLAAVWGLFVRDQTGAVLQEALIGGVCGYLAWGSLPSSQDWAVAAKYPIGTVSVLLVYLCGAWLLWSHF